MRECRTSGSAGSHDETQPSNETTGAPWLTQLGAEQRRHQFVRVSEQRLVSAGYHDGFHAKPSSKFCTRTSKSLIVLRKNIDRSYSRG